jgi:hypothetical protein
VFGIQRRVWLEAIFTGSDIEGLIKKLTPVTINLGTDEEERFLRLERPSEISLVPEKCAIRVVTRAKVRWSLSVLSVPVTVESLQVLLRPTIVPGATLERGTLAFHLELEEADFRHIPAFADRQIRQAINAALVSKPLAWDFGRTLSDAFAFELPIILDPLEKLRLDVAWGEMRMTSEALVFAVSFHPTVTRRRTDDDSENEAT